MSLGERRRALMAGSVDEPNGLVPSASAGKGNSIASISSDGLLYIDYFSSGWENGIKAVFKRPINFKSGDTIAVKLVRKSGSLSPRYSYVDLILNDTLIISNKIFDGASGTAFNQSQMISADINANYLLFANRTHKPTGTNYSVEIQISINGERVI